MAESSKLPLLCTICPKKPSFSDVSHLLTHVASKGHLSHYYRLKVRAARDPESWRSIEEYDQWYVDWGIEKLMSERMSLKEQRKPRSQVARTQQRLQPTNRNVDPRLSSFDAGSARFEQKDVYQLGNPYSPQASSLEFDSELSKNRPLLHLWSTSLPTSYYAIPIGDSAVIERQAELSSTTIHNIAPLARMVERRGSSVQEEEETVVESTKLKGILWPGMDIFDAAPPEVKRRRNQKKDVSVIEHLEESSLQVQPTEQVYTPSGRLKKSRFITGEIDYDSSPLKEFLPHPQPRRKAGFRKPLMERDVNTGKIAVNRPSTAMQYQHDLQPVRYSPGFAGGNGRSNKRGFTVFKDEDHRSSSTSVEPTMRYLTAEFRQPPMSGFVPHHGSPAYTPFYTQQYPPHGQQVFHPAFFGYYNHAPGSYLQQQSYAIPQPSTFHESMFGTSNSVPAPHDGVSRKSLDYQTESDD